SYVAVLPRPSASAWRPPPVASGTTNYDVGRRAEVTGERLKEVGLFRRERLVEASVDEDGEGGVAPRGHDLERDELGVVEDAVEVQVDRLPDAVAAVGIDVDDIPSADEDRKSVV